VVKIIRILVVLLVLQLIFTGFAYVENQQMAASTTDGKLLKFTPTQVDQLVIRGPDNIR